MTVRTRRRVAFTTVLLFLAAQCYFDFGGQPEAEMLKSLETKRKVSVEEYEHVNGGSLPIQEMCKATGRCSPMDSNEKFSFVHIPKVAGTSLIATLKLMFPEDKFFPQEDCGAEYSVYNQKVFFEGKYQLTSLRSPRHHVWSQFTECKYDEWGINITRGTGFPRTGEEPENDIADFEQWLNHFHFWTGNDGWNQGRDDYDCYHPANLQSRYFSMQVGETYEEKARSDTHHIPHEWQPFEPYRKVTFDTYWEEDWVAIKEFYHESQCLLFYRLTDTPEANEYVEQYCMCPKPQGGHEKEKHITHFSKGKRTTLRDLPAEVLTKVGVLTKVDEELFKVALGQFMKEIAWLESDLALGRRILCEPALENVEEELLYLGVNVTDMYHREKDSIKQEMGVVEALF